MPLTKNDLKQIRGVVKEEVTEIVDKKIDDFALVAKKSFDHVDKRFDENEKAHKINQNEHIQIRKDIAGIQVYCHR